MGATLAADGTRENEDWVNPGFSGWDSRSFYQLQHHGFQAAVLSPSQTMAAHRRAGQGPDPRGS